MTKSCVKCREDKPLTEFNVLTRARDGRHYRCRECVRDDRKKYAAQSRDYCKRWYAENREKYLARRTEKRTPQYTRRKWIWDRYGLTDEDFARLEQEQNFRCAICGSTSEKPLHVDHDHDTGRVRGLLCSRCNFGLGLFGDNPNVLIYAIQYLAVPGEECP